jgi:hypothetical protein
MRSVTTLIVASTVLALGLAELALRIAQPLWAIPYPPRCYRPALFEQWNPYGYRLHPSRTMTDVYPFPSGATYTITSNADGFRDRRALGDADPRPRILVLGDSMIFGPAVEEPDRVTERLETQTPGWRVDNLGMVGFGPDLMLRALEQVGLATHPKIVVLLMFTHDVYRVAPEAFGVGFAIPRYALRDGALVSVPYPVRPWWMRLDLVQGVRYAWLRYTAATYDLNEAILDRFVELGRTHGFTFALAFVPGPHPAFDDGMRSRFLARWATAAAVPYVDMTEPLAFQGGPALYLPNDAHWNADGHRVASGILGGFLAPIAGSVARRAPQSSSN